MPTTPPRSDLGELKRRGLKRFALTLLPHGVLMLLLALAVWLGLAEPWQVAVLVGYAVPGLFIFFILLRGGVALRFKDPLLVYPQVLFNIGMVALTYALLDIARAVAMEVACLVLVFDMRRLAMRQLLTAVALAMGLPALGVYVASRLQPGRINLGDQAALLLLAAAALAGVLVAAAQARKLRLRRERQQQEMAAALTRLQDVATRDGLTGLYNRRHMLDLLHSELGRMQRTGRAFSVAILDIDFFKLINDQLGHAVGDAVLQRFSALSRASFQRQTDALARWGGEEFLLLMPETSESHARAVVARLHSLVRACDWKQLHALEQLTFSAGVCEHLPGASLAQTLEGADQALYRAKAGGRDRTETATDLPHAGERGPLSNWTGLPVPDTPPQAVAPAGTQATPLHATRPAAPRRMRWVDWVLGSDMRMRASLLACLAASGIYTAALLVLTLYTHPVGLISAGTAALFQVLCALGAVVPYALMRSGWGARLGEQALSVSQMLWAFLALVLAYGLIPESHSFVLQMLCGVLIFGFIDLNPRQAMTAGIAATAMLLGMYGALVHLRPDGFDPAGEGLQVAATALILTLLTLQSRDFALVREHLRGDRQRLNLATEQLREVMARDPLTGLPNRQHLQGLLERECDRHTRSGHSFCVALIDLDHFKRVNDSHGHLVGDEALVGFAEAARRKLREIDVMARWGGEEFLLLLPETEPEPNGLRAVERLREHLARQRLCAGAPDLVVTFSAGVALHQPGEPLAHLLDRADRALYAAKAQGRNRCALG